MEKATWQQTVLCMNEATTLFAYLCWTEGPAR